MSSRPLLKPSLYRHVALLIVILVLTGRSVTSFAKEEDTAAIPSSLTSLLVLKRQNQSHNIPDTKKLKQLFGNDVSSSTSGDSIHQEETLSRKFVNVLKPSYQRKYGGIDRKMTDEETFSCLNPYLTQVGMNIDSEGAGDLFGYSVALSADGTVMAVGAINNDGINGEDSGHVRVFRQDDSSPIGWIQIGQDLDGERGGAFDDSFGFSVAISDDGNVVAAGGKYADGAAGYNTGHVRVFQRNTLSSLGWSQIGQDIDGEYAYDLSGTSVDLSGDGNVLAIGAPSNGDGCYACGHVRIYRRDSTFTLGWEQVGGDIDGGEGDNTFDYFGISVALSKIGNIVAIGGYYNDNQNGDNSGHVRVYKRDPLAALGWRQDGDDIDGEAATDYSGYSVSLSDDGETLAIGAYNNDGSNGMYSGHVRVYGIDQSSPLRWTQIGGDIDGEAASDASGGSVALSGNGEIIAIGAIYNDGNGSSSGHVRVFRRDLPSDIGWSQVGKDIDGDVADDQFGWRVALSRDGEVVAAGAPFNDGNGDRSGHVKVFQQACVAPTMSPAPTLYLQPSAEPSLNLVPTTSPPSHVPTNIASFQPSGAPSVSLNPSSQFRVYEWTQEGEDIDGTLALDYLGSSVALSADGKILAVGAPTYSALIFCCKGYVRVFRRDNNATEGWVQIGEDLEGDEDGDSFGHSVALSNDGEVLAIGSNVGRGLVRVFQRDALTSIGWSQIGQDIKGDEDDGSGESVALSSSGEILAIGGEGSFFTGKGVVRVYQRTGNPSSTLGWEQIGNDLDGEASGDHSGNSVALSNSGDIVAIGASDKNSQSGHVRVYKRDSSTVLGWTQEGEDIDGESSEQFGSSVALSDDGDVLAVGAKWNSDNGIRSGQVRVYLRHTPSTLGWTQIGGSIDGEASYDLWGFSVALSGDGNRLVAGASDNNIGNNYNGRGHVRVFRRDSSAFGWEQVGDDIDGERKGDQSGSAVAISKDGEVVAVGAPNHDVNIDADDYYDGYYGDKGQVRVFKSCACKDSGEELAPGVTCSVIQGLPANAIDFFCGFDLVSETCAETCGLCSCTDSEEEFAPGVTCAFVQDLLPNTIELACGFDIVAENCPVTCGLC